MTKLWTKCRVGKAQRAHPMQISVLSQTMKEPKNGYDHKLGHGKKDGHAPVPILHATSLFFMMVVIMVKA